MSYKLMLHSGANVATREQVMATATPEPTETHYPVPHATMIETVEKHIVASGFTVDRQEYGLWNDGMRMFGVWCLGHPQHVEKDWRLAIGLRNAHDKAFSASFGVGENVFVCDNMSFHAEIMVVRKHTRYVLRDLDGMIAEAAGKLGAARVTTAERIAAYKATELTDVQVHDILVRSVDARVIANAALPKVLKEWRTPTHEDFAPRTAWSLQNAYTEVMKAANPQWVMRRTVSLTGMLDGFTGAFGVKAATPDFGAGLERLGRIEHEEVPADA